MGLSVTLCQQECTERRRRGSVTSATMFGGNRQSLRRAAPMSVFHVPCVSATGKARAAVALERLTEHVDAMRIRPLAGEDFERVERELHERFVEAEREVLGELLERLDVDAPSVALGGSPIPSGASQHRELYDGGGAGDGRAHAVPVRARTRGGPDGASRRDCRGALDGAGGTAGELRGGADDAERGRGAAARARQHGAVEELARPLAQGARCALGGEPRRVRIDAARGDGGCPKRR